MQLRRPLLSIDEGGIVVLVLVPSMCILKHNHQFV